MHGLLLLLYSLLLLLDRLLLSLELILFGLNCANVARSSLLGGNQSSNGTNLSY